MSPKQLRWLVWLLVLVVATIFVIGLALMIGSAAISPSQIVKAFFEGKGSSEYSIVFELRLPRIILGFAIGASLSLAGVILQGLFRNPLVEPYTLGISGGAALGVALGIVSKLYLVLALPFFGFFGAFGIIGIIYLLSLRKGVLKIKGLLLTGVMLSFIASALIMLIMSLSHSDDLQNIVFWIMGSLEEPNLGLINAAFFVAVSGLIITYLFAHSLNLFALGEEQAKTLGVNTEVVKRLLFFLAALLTGFSVALAGIIGFVGLVVPHFMRIFVGSDHRILLVSSFLGGGIFLIFSDTLARTIIAPLELPVGVITGIIGGGLFIWALTKRENGLGVK